MLHFRIFSTFRDLLQGNIVFWTILFQLSVGICPRICKSSLSFLDIQNRSKSAKKPDSTLWFFTLKTLKMLILEQNMWKTPFCMKSSFLVWNVFKPVFREKTLLFENMWFQIYICVDVILLSFECNIFLKIHHSWEWFLHAEWCNFETNYDAL